ncbi:Helix-turn-helix domain protein [Planctomycetes bacterium Pan216]|uniref:Helix-turn-helix domain protein n=1 Tax=Kolteria novifilia TaxID=2527975 RepID=A0A518B2K8_9BACT|nr:Helix-turn-helix domain protein [Planctomycetes bacterium Pan216]
MPRPLAEPDTTTPEGALGAAIRKQRMRKGLKLAELANAIQSNHTLLGRYESGKHVPTVRQIIAIARVVGCKPSTLVKAVDEFASDSAKS